MVLFKTKASGLDSAQASLALQLFLYQALRASNEREDGAWSRIQSRNRGFRKAPMYGFEYNMSYLNLF